MACLPDEIERMIFEYATIDIDRNGSVSILLVARRVFQWIRPSLYRILIMPNPNGPRSRRFPRTRSLLKDVGPFVHHALVSMNNVEDVNVHSTVRTVLNVCRNLRSFAVWFTTSDPAPIIKNINNVNLKPKKLSISFKGLTSDHFRSNAFKNITHLDVLFYPGPDGDSETGADWSCLVHLSALTHLFLGQKVELTVLVALLDTSGRFRLALLVLGPELLVHIWDESYLEYETISDSRLVLLYDRYEEEKAIEDWKHGAAGFCDVWMFTERVSYARSKNLFSEEFSGQRWVRRELDWLAELNAEGKTWWHTLDWD